MEFAAKWLFPVLTAFVASGGFSVIYNSRGVGILICALGGALGWLAYMLSALVLHSDIAQTFIAAIAISVYAEIMARVRKFPATTYLLAAYFPLVPGGGIYFTMEYALANQTELFLASLLHTIGLAGAMAVGVLMVSSTVRMWTAFHSGIHLIDRGEDLP